MKKYFIFVALLVSATALAQTDIVSKGPGPFYTLAEGDVWGTKGIGGIENAYIVYPKHPSDNVCFNVRNNNPTNGHNLTVRAYVSNQPDVNGFYSMGASGSNYPAQFWGLTTLNGAYFVANNQQINFMIPAAGATAVAFQITTTITSSGTPDTADIFAISSSAPSCGAGWSSSTVAPIIIGTTVGASITPSPRTHGELPITRSPYSNEIADTLTSPGVYNYILFGADAGQFSACTFEITATLAGTSPTLSAEIQESMPDGTTWNDVVYFNQFTGTGGTQAASINSTGSLTPYMPGPLTAGSVRNGMIVGNLRVQYTLAGNGVSANVYAWEECQ